MSPGGSGLQAALGHLLTSADLRNALRDRPAEIGRRYRLSDEELRLLCSLDHARLDLTAHAGEAKRVDFLRRGMPLTLGAIERAGRADILRDHLNGGWTTEGPVLTSRVLDECRRLAAGLAVADPAGLPPWIGDMASFELAAAELLASADASADAERARNEPLPQRGPVALGRHVRLLNLSYDVVAMLADPAAEAAKPTCLVLVKSRMPPPLQAYRVGSHVADILCSWTMPRQPAAVMASLPGLEKQVAETIRTAMSASLLLAAC
jgi:hypothetical protein